MDASAGAEGRQETAGNQPLRGTGLPPRVGSPASRNACKIDLVKLAPVFGEKADRLAIAPPSSVATMPQGIVLARVIEIQNLYLGAPSANAEHLRSSGEGRPHPTLTHHFGRVRTVADSGPALILDRFDCSIEFESVSPRLNSWTTRKPETNSTLWMCRNGGWACKRRCSLGSGVIRRCGLWANRATTS